MVCIWAHLPEPDFLTNIEKINTLAHVAKTNQPAVEFRYCTAIEAMQRWMRTADQTPPQLDVSESEQNGLVTLTIRTSESIFQPSPAVAIKDVWEQYRFVKCANAGLNAWNVTLPLPKSELAKIGIAVTDPSGNLATKILRYLPDDLYLDNLDSQYSELEGNWKTTTNAAWGINARIAVLGPQEIARVRWSLPITKSASYGIFVQVPTVINLASNVVFNVLSDGTSVGTSDFHGGLPPVQWLHVTTAFLNASASNSIEMAFSPGLGQSNATAVADVIRVTPLVTERPLIGDVHVEPSDTTACLTWRTLAPTPTMVRLGLDQNYDSLFATNSLPVSNHVATFTNLAPDTAYFFRIEANLCGAIYLEPGSFVTTNYTRSQVLFGLTNSWKFTTQNLEGVYWKARGYDDSAWSAGPGLLWVDNRGGASSTVKSRTTEMPFNQVTGFPFPTYYFRTHFTWTGDRARTSLIFSNFIDDGAVFYLNGAEIYRLNMAPAPTVISNASFSTAYSCTGDATCPVIFNIAGNLMTNLMSGDNTLAVEVHNYSAKSPDITFGSALFASDIFKPLPELHVLRSDENVTVFWNGSDLTLQWADRLSASLTPWRDVSGAATSSPYTITNIGDAFYRLRR